MKLKDKILGLFPKAVYIKGLGVPFPSLLGFVFVIPKFPMTVGK